MSEVISHFKAVNGDEGFGEWEVDQVGAKLFSRHVATSMFVKVNVGHLKDYYNGSCLYKQCR